MSQLFIDNDNYLHLTRFRDAVTRQHIIDATITASVKDLDGNEIVSGIDVEYIDGTDSEYLGEIPSGTSLDEGNLYQVILESTNYGFKIRRIARAVTRE